MDKFLLRLLETKELVCGHILYFWQLMKTIGDFIVKQENILKYLNILIRGFYTVKMSAKYPNAKQNSVTQRIALSMKY